MQIEWSSIVDYVSIQMGALICILTCNARLSRVDTSLVGGRKTLISRWGPLLHFTTCQIGYILFAFPKGRWGKGRGLEGSPREETPLHPTQELSFFSPYPVKLSHIFIHKLGLRNSSYNAHLYLSCFLIFDSLSLSRENCPYPSLAIRVVIGHPYERWAHQRFELDFLKSVITTCVDGNCLVTSEGWNMYQVVFSGKKSFTKCIPIILDHSPNVWTPPIIINYRTFIYPNKWTEDSDGTVIDEIKHY